MIPTKPMSEDVVDASLKNGVDIAVYIMSVPIPPILVIVGLFGNSMSFILMNQKKYEKSTACFYMRVLAFSTGKIL
jgi:hypothetical protein